MSNSFLKWSALIYGRTYEVDFRLIAMPEYFDTLDRSWAENYILATTQIPEKLPGCLRWSLFANRKYCMLATTCMVRELFPNYSSPETKDITVDFRGRPLYAFIGYVAERDESGQFPTLPAYSDLKLEQFQLLYQKYVEQCWELKPYQPQSKQPIFTTEEDVKFNFTENSGDKLDLNLDPKIIRVWSEEYQSDVWNTVIQEIDIFHKPISVCLGLSTQKDAENSPFLNATVLRLDTSRDGRDFERHIDKPSPQKNKTETINFPTMGEIKNGKELIRFSTEYQHESITNTPINYDSNVLEQKIQKLIFWIVIYLFDNKGIDVNEIFSVSTAKIQQLEKSLIIHFKNQNFDGIYSFFEHEYKQSFTDRQTTYDENIQELQKITSIDRTTLESQLKSDMEETPRQELMAVINNMFNFVSRHSSNTVPEEQQQKSSNKFSDFGFKTIKHDKNSIDDGNKSKDSKPEAVPNKDDQWF